MKNSDLNDDRWKTCDGCQWTHNEAEDVVIHADRWDSAKRISHSSDIEYEIKNAKHRGQWVVIKYEWKACSFDDKPVMPKGLHHNCPWHGKTIKKEESWWE